MGLIQQIKKDEDLDKTYANLMGTSNSSSESGNSEEEPVIEKQTGAKNSSDYLVNVNTTMVKYSDAEERLQQDVSSILQEKVAQNPDDYTADAENLQAVQERKTKLVIDSALNLMENGDYKVPRQDRQQVSKDVAANIVGFGVLQKLLDNDDISEIMVNGAKSIYVEEKGLLHLTDVQFKNEAQCSQIIDRILAPLGRHVDEASPDVDARLPDGSRVNVIIPPLALNGNVITIRKFPKSSITMDDMIKFGSLDRRMASFLEACVLAKESTIVSGSTSSGKTTLLNALSGYIPSNERILTIEDSAELRLLQDHVVRLESRPANIDGKGRVTINDLVINALRMRPDRLIVGECRGEETLAMLQAMNTGHDGSLTTVHANHSKDVVSRLETMASMASTTLSEAALKAQIASAINIIVQQARLQDGSRKIVEITEITGMEGNVISMQKIFEFVQTGVRTTVKDGKMVKKVEGYFDATGVRPKCYDKFMEMGIHVGDDWFEKRHKE